MDRLFIKLSPNKLLVVLALIFICNHITAQLYFKVRKKIDFISCISSDCNLECCSNERGFELDGRTIRFADNVCGDAGLKSFLYQDNVDQQLYCLSIEKEEVGFFKSIKPQYLYSEFGASWDYLVNNPSHGPFANALIGYQKPLKKMNQNNLWLIAGIRTGVAVGYTFDTNPEVSNNEIIRLFKTEATIGLYSANNTHYSLSFGFNPLNIRDGENIRDVLYHISTSISYPFVNDRKDKRVNREN